MMGRAPMSPSSEPNSGKVAAVEQHRIAALPVETRRDDRRQGLAVALDQRGEQLRGNARLIGQEEEDGRG